MLGHDLVEMECCLAHEQRLIYRFGLNRVRCLSRHRKPWVTHPWQGVRDAPRVFVMSEMGLVSRVSPVQTAVRNCTRDEGRPFEVGNQVLIPSHRKLLLSKAMVVSVAETSGQ